VGACDLMWCLKECPIDAARKAKANSAGAADKKLARGQTTAEKTRCNTGPYSTPSIDDGGLRWLRLITSVFETRDSKAKVTQAGRAAMPLADAVICLHTSPCRLPAWPVPVPAAGHSLVCIFFSRSTKMPLWKTSVGKQPAKASLARGF